MSSSRSITERRAAVGVASTGRRSNWSSKRRSSRSSKRSSSRSSKSSGVVV